VRRIVRKRIIHSVNDILAEPKGQDAASLDSAWSKSRTDGWQS
jgi:hypothetical protein